MRDFTKGHPEIEANNHPIRHGSVVGIHNGIIENDDALLARYRIERAEPQMTVDSEAIFALMERRRHDPRALSELRGAMAAAWIDDARRRRRCSSRAAGSGHCGSAEHARRPLLRVDAACARDRRGGAATRPDVSEVREGRLLHVVAGRVVRERRFRPDRRYREAGVLPPVRAPREAVSCLERFAALASVSPPSVPSGEDVDPVLA